MRRRTRLSGMVLLVFLGLLAAQTAIGQQSESAKSKSAKPDATPKRQVRGRLPAYFAAVVTQKQRDEIYRIQARHQDQIDHLRQQIEELETARALEVDAVLRPEQLKEVEKKRTAAEQRRRKRSNPGGEKPSSPTSE